jgi:serine/threonine protein kinase
MIAIANFSAPMENFSSLQWRLGENKSVKDAIGKMNHETVPRFWKATEVWIIMCGLVLWMRFVHSRGIIHRDLQPSNILMAVKGRILIAGFGMSQNVHHDRTTTRQLFIMWHTNLFGKVV